MHDFIHNKCGTSHITRIFHQGNAEIQYQDVGQKYNHSSDSTNDTINHHILQRALGHVIPNQVTHHLDKPLDTHHRVLPNYKRTLEHQIHKKEENGISPNAMGHNGVEHLRCLFLLQMIVGESFFQRSTDKTIFSICQSRFAIFIHCLLYTPGRFIPFLFHLCGIGQSMNEAFYFRIILQQFDSQITGRIFMADKFVL